MHKDCVQIGGKQYVFNSAPYLANDLVRKLGIAGWPSRIQCTLHESPSTHFHSIQRQHDLNRKLVSFYQNNGDGQEKGMHRPAIVWTKEQE